MRTATMAAAVIAAILLAGCSSGDDANATYARGRAKDVCRDLGLNPGGSSGTPRGDSTPVDWAEAAKEGDSLADKAAAAADTDPRWTRLADSINTMTMIVQGIADRGDTGLADDDRPAFTDANRTLHAECRKAFAGG
ncbi:hypothetical protein [Streptomyces sp. NPDC059349]|uniref:hypothetical protein n=1 Tax=Streptomyces sp. NPDC059349 TaxID=3346808 RepID=UPI0036B6EBAF